MQRTLLRALSASALLLVTGCGSVTLPGSGRGPHTFIDSGDYRDGEEIVGVVLHDEDYAKMVEDIERNGADFNWGWVKALDGKPARPATLAFDLTQYSTVRVLPVVNKSMKVAPEIEQAATDALIQAMQMLDLEVVDSESADLELEAAVVDYKSDRTYIYVGMLDPFIEMEGRLEDLATGETLLLFRHQEHGGTPADAAGDTAGQVAMFLR